MPRTTPAQQSDTTYQDTTVIRLGEVVAGAIRPITTSGGASALKVYLDSLRVRDNLTDVAIYDQCGLPQPGRTLRMQVRLR